MKQVELSAGTINYRDTGKGPAIVFVHGLLVDGTLWRKVVPLARRPLPLHRARPGRSGRTPSR